jgi:glycosyltransferase involved in cell wall biosynthesis
MTFNPKYQTCVYKKRNKQISIFSDSNRIGEKVTILVTAYKSQEFVKDLLDSFAKQTYQNFEVIIGVDSCKPTLDKLLLIKTNYTFPIKLYYFKFNHGTIKLRNSLLSHCTGENILLCDSDDMIVPKCLETILRVDKQYEFIQFKYQNFGNENYVGRVPAHGVFFLTKNVYNLTGGFLNWKCGADSEFGLRVKASEIKHAVIQQILLMRRMHGENLTQNKDTGLYSKLRMEYQKIARDNANAGIIKINGKKLKLNWINCKKY